MKSADRDTIKGIMPARIEQYLLSTGWRNTGSISNKARFWHRPEAQHYNLEIMLPVNPTLRDYTQRLHEALMVLAEYEQRSLADVVATVHERFPVAPQCPLDHPCMNSGHKDHTRPLLHIELHIGVALRSRPRKSVRQGLVEALRDLSPQWRAACEEFILKHPSRLPGAAPGTAREPDLWVIEMVWSAFEGELTTLKQDLTARLTPALSFAHAIAVDLHWRMGDLSGDDHLTLAASQDERARATSFLCSKHVATLLKHYGLPAEQSEKVGAVARLLLEQHQGLMPPVTGVLGLSDADADSDGMRMYKVQGDVESAGEQVSLLMDMADLARRLPQMAAILETMVKNQQLPEDLADFEPLFLLDAQGMLDLLVDLYHARSLPILSPPPAGVPEADLPDTRVLH